MVDLVDLLKSYHVKSVKAASLLVKRMPNPKGNVPNIYGYRPECKRFIYLQNNKYIILIFKIDCGFEIGPDHVVGWNFESNDSFRDLKVGTTYIL